MPLGVIGLPIILALGILFGAMVDVKAAPIAAPGAANDSAIVLVQDKPAKKETIKQKAKRVWKNIAGYKFDVACPALLPINRSTCTETGKTKGDAQAKCQARNTFCSVTSAN